MSELKPCPFCGADGELPSGDGTQYEIWCSDCGQSVASTQISDLMTLEERKADPFTNYRYSEEYIERAKAHTIEKWNTRALMGAGGEPVGWHVTYTNGFDFMTDDIDELGDADEVESIEPLYKHPAPAVDGTVPKGWIIERDGDSFHVASPDDNHIIVDSVERAPAHHWTNMFFALCKAIKGEG